MNENGGRTKQKEIRPGELLIASTPYQENTGLACSKRLWGFSTKNGIWHTGWRQISAGEALIIIEDMGAMVKTLGKTGIIYVSKGVYETMIVHNNA